MSFAIKNKTTNIRSLEQAADQKQYDVKTAI